MNKLLLSVLGLALLFTSCTKEEDKKDDTTNTTTPTVVDLSYISKTFKSIKTIHDNLGADAAKTPAQLVEVFNNEIKENTAKSTHVEFTDWIAHMKDNADKEAKKGEAGKLGKRFLNANGIELGQLVKKGFIGSFQLNGYNAAMMQGVGAKDEAGRTAALDKAVTFLLGEKSYLDKAKVDGKYPVYDGNQFVHYMNKVSTSAKYKDMGDKIYAAIKKAYADAGDKTKFNAAILEVNKLVTTTVAFRGVHYLLKAEELQAGFNADGAHEVSEGLAFCYSLQFAYKGHGSFYMTAEQAKEFTEINLWESTAPATLETKAQAIADLFGFTLADAK